MTVELPLRERIAWLTNRVQNASIQEVHSMLPAVVDNIFGFTDGSEGWGLHKVKERQDPRLFNSIKNFLSPKGHFMECIGNKLNAQGSPFKYELPPWLIMNGTLNSFLHSTSNAESSCMISLDAFEYFLLSFVVYPIHPRWSKIITLHELEESVYSAIFSDFLRFYLFTDPEALNILSHRCHTNRPFQQITMYQRNYFYGSTQEQFDASDLNPLSDQGLFWQSEVLLQTICEVLLGWHSENQKLRSFLQGVNILQPSNISNSHSEMSLKPSSCHIFLVRCFLKHLAHAAFNHMTPKSLTTPYQQALWNKISSFHKQLANTLCLRCSVPTTIHQNMTIQLRQLLIYCFQHWPCDLSFEIVLETWLTAIQPWRYADTTQPHGSSTPIFEPTDHERSISSGCGDPVHQQFNTWVAFATAQYSLYAMPLLLFLQRAVRMDLRVLRNAYMVHRVTKVLSQHGFKSMLQSAEESLVQETLGTVRSNYAETQQTLINVEKTGLWSSVFYEAADRLIQALQSSQAEVRDSLTKKSELNMGTGSWGRLMNFVSDLILDNGNRELKNLQKCNQYMNEIITALKTFFNMDQNDVSDSQNACTVDSSISGRLQWDDVIESPLIPVGRSRSTLAAQTPSRRVQFADRNQTSEQNTPSFIGRNAAHLKHSVTRRLAPTSPEVGSELTPRDRFQILMGQRKPDIRFTGDRDFLPPCSYEVPALVELLNALSGFLNIKMREKFTTWCSQPGFVGWVGRQLLLPSYEQNKQDAQYDSCSPVKFADLNPKVSLRWLASYSILIRFALLYLICFVLFGIRSPFVFFLGVFIFYCIYQFVRLTIRFTKETMNHYWSND